MTDVDLDKKTYAVITFAEFARAMQQMSEKMGEKTGDGVGEFQGRCEADRRDANINGFQTKETVLTLEIEGQDKKSGEKGAMTVVTDMWLAPNLPGYEEVRSFYARMAQKLAWAPGMGGMGAMTGRQAGMMKGMSQMYKEASKLEGVPVLQVVRMGGMAGGMSEADMAKMQEAQSAGTTATKNRLRHLLRRAMRPASAATGAALGRMGKIGGLAGAAGGFGGFGRKKKQQQQEEPAAQAQQQAQTPPPAPDGSRSLGRDASGNSDGDDHGTDRFLLSASGSCKVRRASRLQTGRARDEESPEIDRSEDSSGEHVPGLARLTFQ